MHKQSWLLIAALALVGCEPGAPPVAQPTPPNTSNTVPSATGSETVADATKTGDNAVTQPAAADNTAVNERDANAAAKTPIDQNENEADIQITSDIRKQVVAEKTFSINAQNIKIITADGKVTLRGPVKSQSEKDTIEKIAHEVAGKDKVDSQIEIVQ